MSTPQLRRRRFLGLATLAPLGAWALSSCGTSGPGGSGGQPKSSGSGGSGGAAAGTASMWALTGQPNQDIFDKSVKTFNTLGKGTMKVNFFENDPFKTKIRTAVGAGQAPTLFQSWGGGVLRSYVEANQVEDLTSSWLDNDASFKNSFIDSTWGAATINGKAYGLPYTAIQPVVMYYNTKLFDKAGAQIPKTWDDLMNLVDVFNKQGVAPIGLGGASKWTSMMWLEFLFDRIGGPQVFGNIFANKKDAWSDPTVIKSCTMVQDLIKAKGFIKGFSSITADSNADQALLYTGKAAMLLHGAWVYAGIKSVQPNFVKNDMAWSNFPAVSGGKGDPKDTIGNPANYLAMSAKASDAEKKTAETYLKDGMCSDAVTKALVDSGQVPVLKSAKSMLASSPDSKFLQFIYDVATQAPSFQQSWDQALSPTQATAVLTNIDQLFLLKITPEQFAKNMNATIGK